VEIVKAIYLGQGQMWEGCISSSLVNTFTETEIPRKDTLFLKVVPLHNNFGSVAQRYAIKCQIKVRYNADNYPIIQKPESTLICNLVADTFPVIF